MFNRLACELYAPPTYCDHVLVVSEVDLQLDIPRRDGVSGLRVFMIQGLHGRWRITTRPAFYV